MPFLRLHLAPSDGGPLAARSDDELMTLAQAGVREAFAVLVARHASKLIAACARFVSDAQTGRELAQETWLAVWSERARYRRDGRFVVWLHTLARNRCRNHLRHRGVTQSYARTNAAEAHASGHADAAEIDRLLEDERRRHVQEALARLPENMREVLVLRFTQELRYDEIADVLRVRESTLRSRVHHALKLLRGWLEDES